MNTRSPRGFTCLPVLALLFILSLTHSANGQGNLTLWGEVKVKDSATDVKKPLSLNIVLYNLGGVVVGRQSVPTGGRYRFNNMRPGEYDLGIEVETTEIARVHVSLGGLPGSDFRQDLEFEWKPTGERSRPSTVSADELYNRPEQTAALFRRAQTAVDSRKYADAVTLLLQVVEKDKQDFQAWTELGTAYLLQKKNSEAENAYVKAIEVRPTFKLALLNLGRVRVSEKKFEEAIEPLTKVVELEPGSGEANYLLGEAYLQTKKGSKAVTYLTEAAKLGRSEAHLRLATLYNAVGMKEKAANEYVEYLKKNPDTADRKKIEQYIEANKAKP